MPPAPARPLVRDVAPAELVESATALGAKPFQARALRDWVWVRGARSFEAATDVPKHVRTALSEVYDVAAAREADASLADDGTRKLLLALRDGETVEMVLIPEGSRSTVCVSTQVGCPVACVFCASGLDGVRRNLTAAEIIEQFVIARASVPELTNLVVMGLGEPMLNLEALSAALARISDPDGFAFSARRITVSTSGYPDRIRAFAREGRPYNLAVSLHAADPALREELVPTATHEPRELVRAAQDWLRATGREPTFEIVLLAGINDDPAAADALARLLDGVQCTINLLPWNRVDGVPRELRTPTDRAVEAFRARLESRGHNVTWRRRRGSDKNAACGQLRLRRGPLGV